MINILIIDDEELNLRIIEESLEGSGYILTKAIDGSQAWEILKKKKVEFAAIILDRLMPVMDGIEVLKLIKSDRDLREIPVVLQTALSGNKDIIDGLESGAFYYLTKPYSKKVLISITNLAVEGYFKYKKAREDLKLSQNVLKYIKNGEFYIKNFDHVLALAPVLSNAFPEPSRVLTGIMEIMHNAIEHGNLEIGYELKKELQDTDKYSDEVNRRFSLEKYKNRSVEIKLEKLADSIHLYVKDEGKGFNIEEYTNLEKMSRNVFLASGRGIMIAKKISFDELIYHGSGNQVEAIINLN